MQKVCDALGQSSECVEGLLASSSSKRVSKPPVKTAGSFGEPFWRGVLCASGKTLFGSFQTSPGVIRAWLIHIEVDGVDASLRLDVAGASAPGSVVQFCVADS
jgi:hypothetical protein